MEDRGLICVYRAFPLHKAFNPHKAENTVAENTVFFNTHGTLSKIDLTFGHKMYLYKIKRIEIVSNIFSNYDALKIEVNTNRNEEIALTEGS